MALDSANNHLLYNLNTRIQILGLLNKKKDDFDEYYKISNELFDNIKL